jgi:hypothetical protein
LAIEQATRGDAHPTTGGALSSLALLCGARGDQARALQLLRESIRIEDQVISDALSFMPDSRRTQFLGRSRWARSTLLSLTRAHFQNSAEVVCRHRRERDPFSPVNTGASEAGWTARWRGRGRNS